MAGKAAIEAMCEKDGYPATLLISDLNELTQKTIKLTKGRKALDKFLSAATEARHQIKLQLEMRGLLTHIMEHGGMDGNPVSFVMVLPGKKKK